MAMRGMIDWKTPISRLAQGAEGYAEQLGEAVFQIGEEEANAIADDARENHRWTNRTGEAEASIYGRAERRDNAGFRIVVGGSAPHVIYLERRWGGKYAGITPALQRGAPRVMSRVRGLIS